MSNLDERIIKITVDNVMLEHGVKAALTTMDELKNSLQMDGASKGLQEVQDSLNNLSTDNIEGELDSASSKFESFTTVAQQMMYRLTGYIADVVISLGKSITVKPLMDGLHEYETQIGSVQTILSNAGDKLKQQGYDTQEAQIEKINSSLDTLNTYADKTIYNFSEMTRNIGTFTAAGVDLDTATTSIQGIANLAAASGSSSQQASTAMYQLSQAIAAGSLKLQDWNSVVNAGMGGELFQNALKRTARAHGVAVDEMIEKNGSFRESLQEGWITSDILTETLQQLTMTTEGLTEAEIEEMKTSLEKQGYTREEAEAILELANNAQDAATKVRTWTQLWDTIGEALGSGWAATWRIIIGDFLEATDLFTHISNGLTGLIDASSNARNSVLQDWSDMGGRNALVDGIKYSFDAILSVVTTVGQAFGDVFGITAEQLKNITVGFAEFAEKLVPGEQAIQFIYDAFYNVFTIAHSVLGVFGNFVRILFNIAKAVWSAISPFVEFAVLLGGVILSGLARLSSFLLLLTDGLEGFISVISSVVQLIFGTLYGAISKLVNFIIGCGLDKAFDAIKNAIKTVSDVVVTFVKNLNPLPTIMEKASGVVQKISGFFGILTNEAQKSDEKLGDMAVTSYETLTPFQKMQVLFEDVASKANNFAKEFSEAEDKVGFLKDKLVSFVDTIKSKFKGFFDNLLNPKLLATNVVRLEVFLRRKILEIFGDNEVGHRVLDIFDSTFGKVLGALNRWIYKFDTFGNIFENMFSKFKAPKFIADTFNQLKTYFKDLFGSAKPLPEKIATLFFDIYDKLAYGLTHIPEIAGKVKDVLSSDFNTLKDTINGFFGEGGLKGALTNFINNLPSPSEILTKLKEFVGSLKTGISSAFDSLKNGNFSFDVGGIFSNIFSGFEGFKLDFPVDNLVSMFSGFASALKDGISAFMEKIPIDDIKSIVETVMSKLGDLLWKRSWSIVGLSFVNFISSIATLNRGIGKFGKNFGNSFKSFGESIGDGLKNFGEGFTSFKKQTKAQAFMRIATGILILAGALWVLAQIPAERLSSVAITLGALALGVAVLMTAMAGMNKLANLDLEGTGKAIAGFGIGMIALAGAVWIFSKIPADQVDENMARVMGLITLVSLMLMGISATGGNLQGAAATLMAMGAAIILLMIPIEILGRTPPDVLVQGGLAVTGLMLVLAGCVALMEFASKKGASIASAAPALLALAVSIVLLLIPVEILGRTPQDVLIQGEVATGALALVLAGAIALMELASKNSASLLAAAPAMIALAISVSLMMIPIFMLGSADQGEIKQGIGAVTYISVLLAAVIIAISLVGASAGTILAGSAALIVLAVAVGMIAAVLAVLAIIAKMDLGAMQTAMIALGEIFLGLVAAMAVLATMGTGAAIGIAAIAGALLLLAAALVALAAAIYILQNGPDWAGLGEAISGMFNSFAESLGSLPDMISTAISSFGDTLMSGLSGIVGSAFEKGSEIKDNIVNGFNDLGTKMKTKASDGMTGMINAIQSKIGAVKSKATEVKTSIVNAFNTLASNMREKGNDAVNGLVGAISGGVGRASSAAASLCQAAKNGLTNLWGSFHSVGVDAVNGFIGGLTSKIGQIASAAADMVHTAIRSAKKAQDSNSPSKVFMAIGGDTGDGYIIGIKKSIPAVAKASESMAEAGIDSFNEGLRALSFDIDDLIDTNYNPVITPVIDPTEFNSDLNSLSSAMTSSISGISIDGLNYTGELSAKISDANAINKQALDAILKNGIDYNLLGVSVANALISSGVYVKMDGGQMVGYLAGEIRDARRQYVR